MARPHTRRNSRHKLLLSGKNELVGGLLGAPIKGSNTFTPSLAIFQA